MARLVSYYLLLSVVTVGLVGYIAFIQAQEALKASVFERLNGVATLKANELNRWVNDQVRDVLFIANLPILRANGETLFRETKTSPEYVAAYGALSQNLANIIAGDAGVKREA